MGMFDQLKVHKKWLPKGMGKYQDGWQTKSLGCALDHYVIKETGELICIFNADFDECYDPSSYTGEVHFYQDILGDWVDIKAWCIKGVIKEIIQLE